MLSDKPKYIRTVLGRTTINELISNNKGSSVLQGYPKITALPSEHLIQNLCDYLNPIEGQDPKELICLKNLSKIIIHPFSFFDNLNLESDEVKISNALSHLSNKYNTQLVCDVTNKTHGNNLSALKEVSKISKVNICTGVSLDYSYQDIKKYSNDLRYELIYGKDDKDIPSFISEVFLKEKFPIDSKEEELFNMLINDVINVHETPIFIKLNGSQKNIDSNTIIPWFNSKKITHKTKIVFEVSIGDYDTYESIKALIMQIVVNGYSVVIGLYDCDINNKEKISNNPIDSYYNDNKAKFINEVLIGMRQYIAQIMISNNINFKIQLKEYGGFGYENIFDNYYKVITKGLTQKEIEMLFYENLFQLLQWWKEIERDAKKAKMIKCEQCGVEKEEDDPDLFRKFDKTFCTFSCLKKYISTHK